MHKAPLATADKRLRGKGTLGIFVVDHFGRIFCADKVALALARPPPRPRPRPDTNLHPPARCR